MANAPRYAVELKADENSASFMSNGKAIELSDSERRYETEDESEYLGIRDLPFLKDLGRVKEAKSSGGDS